MEHVFGGIWTRKKLAVLEAYLRFYVTALKNQAVTLHYADAFAGTGTHVPVVEEDQELLVPYEDFKGSVLTALDVEPGFHRFHFNDLNPDHIAELERIKRQYPGKDIRIYQQDANQFVPDYCASLGKADRAVLLLDPYSTQLDWATLKHVAGSEKVDLWLLFPIPVILRMTPRDRVVPEWRDTLNRLLGTNEWEQALYEEVEAPPMDDMFDDPAPTPMAQRVNTEQLERWVTARFKKLFPFVATPVPLRNRGRLLFLFYFAVSNPRKCLGPGAEGRITYHKTEFRQRLTMSKIEWTEQTWNPVTGCTKVSPGCKHCYAETMSRRLQAMGAPGYENGFKLSLLPERLEQPLRRRKSTMYFVNSMSDLFQDGVPEAFIDRVMDVIRVTPQHTYQILTKRSRNMRDYFATRAVPDNAWLGVSVEDRRYGKPRIPDLLAIKARTRFLSIEPLLEDLGRLRLRGIHWVIVGGESGAGARPMKQDWVINVRNQCLDAGVDFFFKQWGAWGADGKHRSKKANGRKLEGRVWDMMPGLAV